MYIQDDLITQIVSSCLNNVKNSRYDEIQDYIFPSLATAEGIRGGWVEAQSSESSDEILRIFTQQDCIVIGDAGDGKTTLMAKISETACHKHLEPEYITEIFGIPQKEPWLIVPVMLRLPNIELNQSANIVLSDDSKSKFLNKIEALLDNIEHNRQIIDLLGKSIDGVTDKRYFFLFLFDGYDELKSTQMQRKTFLNQLEHLMKLRLELKLRNLKFIITSRNVENLIDPLHQSMNKNIVDFGPKKLKIQWNRGSISKVVNCLGMKGILKTSILKNPLDIWARIDLYRSGSQAYNDEALGILALNETIRHHMIDRATSLDESHLINDLIWHEIEILTCVTAYLSMTNEWTVNSTVMQKISNFIQSRKDRFEDENLLIYVELMQNILSSLPLLQSRRFHNSMSFDFSNFNLEWRHKAEAEALCLHFLEMNLNDFSLESMLNTDPKNTVFDYGIKVGLVTKEMENIDPLALRECLLSLLKKNNIDGGFIIETEGIYKGVSEPSLEFHTYLPEGHYNNFKEIAANISTKFKQETVLIDKKEIVADFIKSQSQIENNIIHRGLIHIGLNEDTMFNKIINENKILKKTMTETFLKYISECPEIILDPRIFRTIRQLFSITEYINKKSSHKLKNIITELRKSLNTSTDLPQNKKFHSNIGISKILEGKNADSYNVHIEVINSLIDYFAKNNEIDRLLRLIKQTIYYSDSDEISKGIFFHSPRLFSQYFSPEKSEILTSKLFERFMDEKYNFETICFLIKLYLNQHLIRDDIRDIVKRSIMSLDCELKKPESELSWIITTAWSKIPNLKQLELIMKFRNTKWMDELLHSHNNDPKEVMNGPKSILFRCYDNARSEFSTELVEFYEGEAITLMFHNFDFPGEINYHKPRFQEVEDLLLHEISQDCEIYAEEFARILITDYANTNASPFQEGDEKSNLKIRHSRHGEFTLVEWLSMGQINNESGTISRVFQKYFGDEWLHKSFQKFMTPKSIKKHPKDSLDKRFTVRMSYFELKRIVGSDSIDEKWHLSKCNICSCIWIDGEQELIGINNQADINKSEDLVWDEGLSNIVHKSCLSNAPVLSNDKTSDFSYA